MLWSAFGLYGIIYRPGTSPFLQMVLSPWPWFHYGAAISLIDNHILGAGDSSPSGADPDSAGRRLASGQWQEARGLSDPMYGDWGLDLIIEDEEEDPTAILELSPAEINQWSSEGQSILQQTASPRNKSDSGLYLDASRFELDSKPTEGGLDSEWTVASLLEAGGLDTQVSRWSHLARARLRDVVSRAVMRPLSPPTQGG